MKLNLRSIYTTPEFLVLIKSVWFFNIKIPTSSFCAEPWGRVTESRIYLEIDSATAGMNALVQNDSSVNGLGWIWNSQNKVNKSKMASLALIIGGLSYRDHFLQGWKGLILIGSPFLPRCEVALHRRIQVLIIHPQYKIFCVKLNLRTKFTTHKLLGIIKKGLVL